MAYITDYAYYENSGGNPEELNWGSYQYVSLLDIVNNFMLIYTGNTSAINNEERYKVLFHAKRAIQELNYDAFREVKILELELCDNLRFVFPQDYVNWVRISMYKDGVLFPLSENIQTNWSGAYLQDNDCKILFDEDGYVLRPEESNIDMERIAGTKKTIYLNGSSPMNNTAGWLIDGNWYFSYGIGGRMGLNTETANANPTFRIDRKGGVINFSSNLAGEMIIVEYVSDGMEAGDNSLITVNKLFEDYVYAYINEAILASKLGTQLYIRTEAKRQKKAKLANARIRIGDMHAGKLLMNLRGQGKWIK